MSESNYVKLPKYVETMNEFVAQSMERSWRKRRRILEHDLSELNGAYASLQSCYWKYDFHRENTALKGSLEGAGKLLLAEISLISGRLEESAERLGEYTRRPGRKSITDRN